MKPRIIDVIPIPGTPVDINKIVATLDNEAVNSEWLLSTNSSFTNPISIKIYPGLAYKINEWTNRTLELTTKYYVKIRYNYLVTGPGEWSDAYEFITLKATLDIAQPAIVSPVNGSVTSEVIEVVSTTFRSYQPNDLHVSTDWEIATDENFEDTVFKAYDNPNLLTILVNSLNIDTYYYVRVRQHGSVTGVSMWSNTNRFKTSNEPFVLPTPVILTPQTNTTIDYNDVLFTSNVFTTNFYDLQHLSTVWEIAVDKDFKNIFFTSSTGNLTSLTRDLSPGTTYWVRVQYKCSIELTTPWSDVVKLTTTKAPYIEPPKLVSDLITLNSTTLGVLFKASPFIIHDSLGIHISTDWEVSKWRDFRIIEHSSYGDTEDLINLQYSGPNDSLTNYCRVRYIADDGMISEWSNVSSFVIPLLDTVAEDPVCYVKIQHYFGVLVDFQLTSHYLFTPSAIYYPISTIWEVATDIRFNNIVYTLTSESNLVSVVTPGLQTNTTYFCRLKHVMSIGEETQWSNVNSFQATISPIVVPPPYIDYPINDDRFTRPYVLATTRPVDEMANRSVVLITEWEVSVTADPSYQYTFYEVGFTTGSTLDDKEAYRLHGTGKPIIDQDIVSVPTDVLEHDTWMNYDNTLFNAVEYNIIVNLRCRYIYGSSIVTDWSNTVTFIIAGTPKAVIKFPVDGDYAVNKCEALQCIPIDPAIGLVHEWTEYGYIDSAGDVIIVRRVTVATTVVATRITLTTLPLAMIPSISMLVVRYKAEGTIEGPWSDPVTFEKFKPLGTFKETARFGNISGYLGNISYPLFYNYTLHMKAYHFLACDASGDVLAHYGDISGLQVYRRSNGVMQLEATLASFEDICGFTPVGPFGYYGTLGVFNDHWYQVAHRKRQKVYMVMSKDGSTIAIGHYQSHVDIISSNLGSYRWTPDPSGGPSILSWYIPSYTAPVMTGNGKVRVYKHGSSGWYLHSTITEPNGIIDKSAFGSKVQLSANGDTLIIASRTMPVKYFSGSTGSGPGVEYLVNNRHHYDFTNGAIYAYKLISNNYTLITKIDTPQVTRTLARLEAADPETSLTPQTLSTFGITPSANTIIIPVLDPVNVSGGYYKIYEYSNGTYEFVTDISIPDDRDPSKSVGASMTGNNELYVRNNPIQVFSASIQDDVIHVKNYYTTSVIRKLNGIWTYVPDDIYKAEYNDVTIHPVYDVTIMRQGEILINPATPYEVDNSQPYAHPLENKTKTSETTCGVITLYMGYCRSNVVTSDDGTKIFGIYRTPITEPSVPHNTIWTNSISETKYTPRI